MTLGDTDPSDFWRMRNGMTRDPFKIDGPTCISFSGGRTSAYMLWRVLQSNGGLPSDAVVCFANTGKESPETLYFVQACAREWSVPITWVEYGRGIKVCDRWASFELFLADMGERPPGTSIDRLDVNGDYRQDNCRWATRREQSLNTTRSRRIAASGIEMTLSEWAEATGLTPNCIRSRIKRGWTPEQAVRP